MRDNDDAFSTINHLAWRAQFDNPASIRGFADEILSKFAEGSLEHAWGRLHSAWAFRFSGDLAGAERDALAAETVFLSHSHIANALTCRELRARNLLAKGEIDAAVALVDECDTGMISERSAWESLLSEYFWMGIAERLSNVDDALRALVRAVPHARRTQEPTAIANTLSMLGGKHAESNNLGPAKQYCAEAYGIAAPLRPNSSWYIAALNYLTACNASGDVALANRIAEELEPYDEFFFPSIREQSNILYAHAYFLGGELARAEKALHTAKRVVEQPRHITEWTATAIEVQLAQGRVQEVLSLGAQWETHTERDQSFVPPSDALRIYRVLAVGCERSGDFSSALKFERKAAEYKERTMGSAARAMRVGLEIEFELDRERAEREESERKRIESESERVRLDELNRKLDAALQTRTRFLAAASHDLRQPAHALALYATALEQETSRAALNELAKRMRATVGSLSNMFDGLLELARLDAGAIAPQLEPFDLADLLDRLCVEYRDRLTSENAVLRFRKPKRACWVASDAVMVERIFRNLIGNAVKYSAGANVMVAVRSRSSGIAIEIRDGGPGMSDEEQRRVFDEFFRAKSAASQRDGLGLGLSIVDRFAKLLGFGVSLRSKLGAGTTFSVLIPTASLSSQVSISQELAKPLGKAVQRRLFVIDDDADARESMALVLSQWGHSCIAAASAAELMAMASARGFTPDALISDYQLAETTAIDGIRQVRASYGDALPVLVVSGSHDAEAQVLHTFPDAAYLPKPVRPLRLKSWIANIRTVS